MRIALLCATRRGYRFLRRLAEAVPGAELVVFSFREEPWEPPFLDDIREFTHSVAGTFFETKQVGASHLAEFWQAARLDLMLVVSWRFMIHPAVYRVPRRGTFVFHDSMLPEYRGFAPTVWAMVNGADHTGVSLFEIGEAVDSGDLIDQAKVPFGPDETIGAVMEKVTAAYLTLLERNIQPLLEGTAPRRPQDHARATYTCKRVPADNRIDWRAPAGAIYNLIRATTHPYPGAYTSLSGRVLRVWSARRDPGPRYAGLVPGRVVSVVPGTGSWVLAADGPLLLTRVQLEEGPELCAAEVLNSLNQTLGV